MPQQNLFQCAREGAPQEMQANAQTTAFKGASGQKWRNKERIEIKGKSEALIDSMFKFQAENIIILRNDMIISSDVGASILDKTF